MREVQPQHCEVCRSITRDAFIGAEVEDGTVARGEGALVRLCSRPLVFAATKHRDIADIYNEVLNTITNT
jgi:hypothetical protein